ncbi:MAG: bifunctional (p)ppGpp synthetase/guanosine-3',5'-bis(diphosphate) 3'-pyrophosphohydrolase [Geminicoccaceae bacterium]|nr:bifunctional (p)ppGpp synthetase/guanosine-3',5'-bis(diphosphate) 3'-pyrophosphohydrolase [Geminicoccaceae bacterium]
MRQYDLVELVKSYDPNADENLLNRAYVFAMKAHGTQLRASGDPYFHHPVEVAGILAGYKLDSASIATGLLHDTVEDTGVTLDEIRSLFGDTVARLVDGVTKLNKIHLQSAQAAQAENFRKLLLAMSEDIRVLLVKLADRLHNMRTLHFIGKPEKRRRIATETAEIYAPLAARIGMEKLKAELEDLAFKEQWPDAYDSIQHRLQQLRRDDTGLIARIVAGVQETLSRDGIEADISGREKSPVSIWRKMQRKNISFEQLADIMAFRVLVDSVGECYAALGCIHAEYSMLPGRFKDFISTPKPNGYRSLHTTIIGPERRKIEVQIRTRQMHEVAELGVAAHWAYKQQDNAVTDGKRYRWIRELLDILEHAASPEDFLEHTKLEIFQDQVFCFTPRGDLIALPRGSTPVDFAYAVHSEVGDHCVGARVDGRMVQLRTELENGDQVEIITSRNAWPSAAWERFVATGKARARIRRYLKTKRREDLVQRGREALQRAQRDGVLKLTERQLEKAASFLQQKSADDMLVAIGEGNLSPRLVIEQFKQQGTSAPVVDEEIARMQPGSPLPLKRPRGDGRGQDRDAHSSLEGLPAGIAFQLAGCCRPVPGDAIVGVVRTGRPVSVHLAECRNVARMDPATSRFIDVGWGEIDQDALTPSRLSVMVLNKPGALGTISTIIGKQDANITDVRVGRRARDLYEMILDVEVSDLEQLLRTQAALRASAIVVGVERIQS